VSGVRARTGVKLSVIVPAYNEQEALPATLARIRIALDGAAAPSELLVVDNASEDTTADVARRHGATVLFEPTHNIAAVRNAGARQAEGDVLIFVDADTRVAGNLFSSILRSLDDPRCFGGAAAVEYDDLQRAWTKWYLSGWRFWASLFHLAQGAAQFSRREAFATLGGYDEGIFMGEDIDFYRRLHHHARRHGGYVAMLSDSKVVTSARRFNKMTPWRLVLLTHPVFIRMTWRTKRWWKDWYENAVR